MDAEHSASAEGGAREQGVKTETSSAAEFSYERIARGPENEGRENTG